MASGRRHRAEGGYPRGEETKARIIRAAIALFGEKGFAGVSTREIAQAADVPAPSLQYYFGNKAGLYQACLADIQDIASKAMEPALRHAEALVAEGAGAESLIEAYCRLLDSMADFMFDAPDADSRALFIAQRRVPSPESKMQKETTLGRRIRDCCTAIIARVSRDEPSAEALRVRAITINGQLLVVHLARRHLMDMIGWDGIGAQRLAALKATIRTQTVAILKSYGA